MFERKFLNNASAAVDTFSVSHRWNCLEVEKCAEASRLTVCKTTAPLRIVNPRVPGAGCHVLLSHCGGGLLEGDHVGLELLCGEGTKLHIGSVGNLQVYKSRSEGSSQHVRGVVGKNAWAVFDPDTVVPHRDSIYRSFQEWHVHPDACLLVAEFMAGGRLEAGEWFAFKEYTSVLSVFLAERLALHDAFVLRPAVTDYRDPAVFAGRTYFLSLYMIGHRWDHVADLISEELLDLRSAPEATILASIHSVTDVGYIVRAVSEKKDELHAVLDLVHDILDDAEFLGFNPRQRKY
jgi:urease accessory protein